MGKLLLVAVVGLSALLLGPERAAAAAGVCQDPLVARLDITQPPAFCTGSGGPKDSMLTTAYRFSSEFFNNKQDGLIKVYVDGKPYTIDPMWAMMTSCTYQVQPGSVQQIASGNPDEILDQDLFISLSCMKPSDWPEGQAWPPTSPIKMAYEFASADTACPDVPMSTEFVPVAVPAASYKPSISIVGGSATYCTSDTEVTVRFKYSTVHVSRIVYGTRGAAYMAAGAQAFPAVKCSVDVQTATLEAVVTCVSTTNQPLPANLGSIELLLLGQSDGVCGDYQQVSASGYFNLTTQTVPAGQAVPVLTGPANGTTLACEASGSISAVFKFVASSLTGLTGFVATADTTIVCSATPVSSLPGPVADVTVTCSLPSGERFELGTHKIDLIAQYYGACSLAKASTTVTVVSAPTALVAGAAGGPAPVCFGKTSLPADFTYTAKDTQGPVRFLAAVDGVPCSANPAPLAGPPTSPAVVPVTCSKSPAAPFPVGTHELTLSAVYNGLTPCASGQTSVPGRVNVTVYAPPALTLTELARPAPQCPNAPVAVEYNYTVALAGGVSTALKATATASSAEAGACNVTVKPAANRLSGKVSVVCPGVSSGGQVSIAVQLSVAQPDCTAGTTSVSTTVPLVICKTGASYAAPTAGTCFSGRDPVALPPACGRQTAVQAGYYGQGAVPLGDVRAVSGGCGTPGTPVGQVSVSCSDDDSIVYFNLTNYLYSSTRIRFYLDCKPPSAIGGLSSKAGCNTWKLLPRPGPNNAYQVRLATDNKWAATSWLYKLSAASSCRCSGAYWSLHQTGTYVDLPSL